MLGAERLLADREGALVKRLRPRIVALGPKQVGEVVEAQRRMGMLGADGSPERARRAAARANRRLGSENTCLPCPEGRPIPRSHLRQFPPRSSRGDAASAARSSAMPPYCSCYSD